MKAAWKLIEERYPHISANGCAAHTVNLLIKDILDTPGNSTTIKEAEKIIKFVTNHHIVKAKFEEKRKALKVNHTLSMAVVTRWFSRYTSLRDLFASKYVLHQLVDENFELLQDISPKITSAGVTKLVKSNEYWDKLAKLVKVIEFPANIIGKLEADNAPLTLVYQYFGELYKHYVNDKTIQEKVKKRLEFLLTDSMGLSFMLDPKQAANGYYFDEDRTDFMGLAKEFALKMNLENADKVEEQMFSFVTKMVMMPVKQQEIIFGMSAEQYWICIGSKQFEELFKVAKPIMAMICSSATSERTWSTFRFIHSRLRNRLTNERVEKLVFIYTNKVLLDEKDLEDYILEDGAVINGIDCEEPAELDETL